MINDERAVLGRNSVLALVLGKIEVLSARFFKVLEHQHVPSTEL
jgi:hypothetical protein